MTRARAQARVDQPQKTGGFEGLGPRRFAWIEVGFHGPEGLGV
jgi:hypothetical protein